jgi:hypothetical protein
LNLNSSRLENLVYLGRNHLAKAIENLEKLDLIGAIKEYRNANFYIQNLSIAYSNFSTETKALKTSIFLIAAEKRFSQIKPNITLSAVDLSEPQRIATLKAVEEAENNLINARELLGNNRILDTIDKLSYYYLEIKKAIEYVETSRIELAG